MSNALNDLLASLMDDFTSGIRISEDRRTVRVRLLRFTNFELVFSHPKMEIAERMRAEKPDYSIPIPVSLINRKSGKPVRGFDHGHINPWWLRRSVFELAAAVAWMEREWDVMSPEFMAMMEAQDKEDDNDD